MDKSEIQKIVNELLLQQGKLTQTIIEYYPPISLHDDLVQEGGKDRPPTDMDINDPVKMKPPAVHRITQTEIITNTEKTTTTDSTAHRNIDTVIRNELHDEVVEKPPSSVIAIRWIVTGIGFVLLIIILIMFRRR